MPRGERDVQGTGERAVRPSHTLNQAEWNRPIPDSHVLFADVLTRVNAYSKINMLIALRERGSLNLTELAIAAYPPENDEERIAQEKSGLGKERTNTKRVIEGNFSGIISVASGYTGRGRDTRNYSLTEAGEAYADAAVLARRFFDSEPDYNPQVLGVVSGGRDTSYKRAILLFKLAQYGELTQESAVMAAGSQLQIIDEYYAALEKAGLITLFGAGMGQMATITMRGRYLIGKFLLPLAERMGYPKEEVEDIKSALPYEALIEISEEFREADEKRRNELIDLTRQSEEATRALHDQYAMTDAMVSLRAIKSVRYREPLRPIIFALEQGSEVGMFPKSLSVSGEIFQVKANKKQKQRVSEHRAKFSDLELHIGRKLNKKERRVIAETLEAYRGATSLSQREIAEEIVPPSDDPRRANQVRSLKNKIQVAGFTGLPTWDTLATLCRYYHVSPGDIIQGKRPEIL